MEETLIDYRVQLRGRDGRTYGARACGRERPDGLWEGWLEFEPVDDGEPLRSSRETTQPSRAILYFWATGLTETYLEGALLRTLRRLAGVEPSEDPQPNDEDVADHPLAGIAHHPFAVLDPYRVHAAGADLLRNQLNALGRDHLAGIVKAYRMTSDDAVIDAMQREELIELIINAVVTNRRTDAADNSKVPR